MLETTTINKGSIISVTIDIPMFVVESLFFKVLIKFFICFVLSYIISLLLKYTTHI